MSLPLWGEGRIMFDPDVSGRSRSAKTDSDTDPDPD